MNRLIPYILIFALITILVGSGIFIGLFSCGGYVWHRQAIYVSIAIAVVLCVVKPVPELKGVVGRVTIPIVSIILFVIVSSLASSFYPSSPGSVGDFFQVLWRGIVYGPC